MRVLSGRAVPFYLHTLVRGLTSCAYSSRNHGDRLVLEERAEKERVSGKDVGIEESVLIIVLGVRPTCSRNWRKEEMGWMGRKASSNTSQE